MMPTAIQHEEPSPAFAVRPSASAARRDQRLRILHVIPQLMPGGTEYALLRLIRALGDGAFEHHICATRGFDPAFAQREGVAKQVRVVGASGAAFQFPLFRLAAIMRELKPHIVHSRNWGGIEAIAAARLARVPVAIHSEHGYEVDSLHGLPLRRRLFRRAMYSVSDAVFANSSELREYHARQAWISRNKIRVIHNGVDTQRFAPDPAVRTRMRRELDLPASSLVLGSVGRLVSIKDHATLLKAASTLAVKGANVKILLVGAGPELPSLQQLAAELAGLDGRVIFAGASDRIPELLNAMDVFVLPSLGEGMSNTILEAMATALPVVATHVGGNPELVEEGKTGFLFSAGDAAGLATTLEKLSRDASVRQQLSVAARQRALAEFSLERMAKEYGALYRELAQKHAGTRRSGSVKG
jgi:sugar transferase (PEP-CTERM/EpsH1 system associated)